MTCRRIGALVADVDLTLIPDGSSVLSGRNLELLVETLLRGIQVVLISGSPYDGVYCGTRASGALERRVASPLQAAMKRRGRPDALTNLTIFYVSGRGKVSFDDGGAARRHPDRTDRNIAPDLQQVLFRSLLAGFYAVLRARPDTAPTDAGVRRFLDTDGESPETVAERVRLALRTETGTDVGTLERWSFESELNLVFHGVRTQGNEITRWARRFLAERKVPLPADLTWAGGPDYAKALRLRKRDTIAAALDGMERDGRLSPDQTVIAVGDSTADDFLFLSRPNFVPLYLGSADAMRDHPGVRTVRDAAGRDGQYAAGFAPACDPFLTEAD